MSLKKKFEGKWFRSIGWKLTVWYAAFFMASALLISLYLYQRLERWFFKEIDFFLSDEMHEFEGFTKRYWGDMESIDRQIWEESMRKHHQMYYAVLNRQGVPIVEAAHQDLFEPARRLEAPAGEEALFQQYETGSRGHKHPVRVVTKPVLLEAEEPHYLRIAIHLIRVEKALARYRENIFLAIPVFAGIAMIGGYILARRNLRPIHELTETANRITAANLDERLPVRGTGDELDRLTETFNRMIQRLDEAYRKLSRFSTDAAHELRTPITAVAGEIEVILAKDRSAEEYRKTLESAFEELGRLSYLVNQLLFISQTEGNGIDREMECLSLGEIVADMADTFQPLAEEKKISIETMIPPGPVWIRGAKWRIEQMLSNLLDNAVRYNYEGGKVRVRLDEAGSSAVLTMKDTGFGIPPEAQDKIFDRFYRVGNFQNGPVSGTGLGLSIVRSIVEAHKGTIEVASAPGQGSVFTVRFPLQPIFVSPA